MRPTRRLAALLAAPLALLLVLGVVVPSAIYLVYSFLTFRLRRVQLVLTLNSYATVLRAPAYRVFAWNTLTIALPVAVLSVLGGFVLAHHIAFRARASRNLLLALVAVSLLGSYLARVYAWRTLLGRNGVVNSALVGSGLVDAPLGSLLFSRFAVVLAEVNLLLPLVCLLVYAGLAGIPDGQREAARDLGAGAWEVLGRVTLPQAGPAVLAAFAFAFFLSAGDYITPVLLGGRSSATLGTAISDQLRVTGNYALGSALSVVTVLGFVVVYALARAVFRLLHLLPEVPV